MVVRPTAWIDHLLFGSTTIETDRAAREARTHSFVFRTEIVFPFAMVTLAMYVMFGALAPPWRATSSAGSTSPSCSTYSC